MFCLAMPLAERGLQRRYGLEERRSLLIKSPFQVHIKDIDYHILRKAAPKLTLWQLDGLFLGEVQAHTYRSLILNHRLKGKPDASMKLLRRSSLDARKLHSYVRKSQRKPHLQMITAFPFTFGQTSTNLIPPRQRHSFPARLKSSGTKTMDLIK